MFDLISWLVLLFEFYFILNKKVKKTDLDPNLKIKFFEEDMSIDSLKELKMNLLIYLCITLSHTWISCKKLYYYEKNQTEKRLDSSCPFLSFALHKYRLLTNHLDINHSNVWKYCYSIYCYHIYIIILSTIYRWFVCKRESCKHVF